MSRVVIIGSEGQDGRLLFDLLQAQGDTVVGYGRGLARASSPGTPPPCDVADPASVAAALAATQPTELYYLAAYHHAAQDATAASGELCARSFAVHVQGLLHCLDAITQQRLPTRVFYAASSRIFGAPAQSPQDESTPWAPLCPYGISKTAGAQLCAYYTRQHGVHTAVGILYNHESPTRPERFVTRKIVASAVRIKRGTQARLVLGDLAAMVDWGYAPDYAAAMPRLLRQAPPGPYVIATGEAHSVGEFARLAFAALDLDYREFVDEQPALLPRRGPHLVGCADRLRRLTGWAPTLTFAQLVARLVAAEWEHACRAAS